VTATETRPDVAVPSWRADLRAAVPGWIAGRVVVGVAWAIQLVDVQLRLDGDQPHHASLGLFAYDADVYRDIAEQGYAAGPFESVRFPPLLPVLGVNGVGILLLVQVCALLAAAVVHRLALEVTDDGDLARRAATLVGLAPPAFTLVWGYSEAPFILLSAAQLLALHRRRWVVAGGLGLLAALTRTSGVLLAVPAAVEAWTSRKERPLTVASIGARALAILGPIVGQVAYLVWVEVATGKGMAPIEIQRELRRGFAFPPFRLLEGIGEVITEPFNDGLHVPFAFGMVALVWVCWKRFPPSWTALSVVSALTALSASLLNSLERYAYGTVPLLVALAAVTGGRWWRPALAGSVVTMVGMTVLAWYGPFVP
jgi:hypothetical protein